MRPPIEFLFPPEIGTELLYSFIIIFCSLMIYFKTKEAYELSSYKGIKYFRQAFLFFAIAYFFRYSILFFLMLFKINTIMEISPGFVGVISLFGFMYASSMAVFYLLYSMMWKKWNHSKTTIYLLNMIALVIALISILFRGNLMYLTINVLLLIFILFVLFFAYTDREKKKGKNLFVIYILLFIFWILNVVNILLPKFLQLYQLIIYLASISLFMIILYKVIEKIGN
jgi:hypothetical protein